MEKLHKEPDACRQDYNAFLNELKQFHLNRGTQYRSVPRINGREVDLYSLYNQVTALGGWQKVNDSQKWEMVMENLKLPKGCINASLALRQIYIRYLGHYEKIHYLGEDPYDETDQSSESRARKQQTSMLHLVPMSYNYAQHEVSDSARAAAGLSQQLVTATDYDKLCLSLLCGLPNEQEFALNVCTILSNEGNHVLHLDQIPRLVDLLLAQAGVWPTNDPLLQNMYRECWQDIKGRNMKEFWRSVLDCSNPDVLKLWGVEQAPNNKLNEDGIFTLDKELGCRNLEGQRVMRVALILYNLSFEKYNIPILAANSNFIRFLLLCIHCKWSYLKHIALDTLGNLAKHMNLSLEKSLCSKIIFKTIVEGIKSSDRYMVIRCTDILSQLCQCEHNEDIIPSKLDFEVYEKMVSLLTVRDIMLLVYSLEALYTLSDLGRYTCEKIVRVHRSIGSLVSLLTIEPHQYGPSAQSGMKLVETLVPAEAPEPEAKATPSKHVSSQNGNSSVQPPTASEVDSETLVSNWLKATYEVVQGYSISRNDIYADYVNFCSTAGRKGVVNASVFANCVRNVFPHTTLKKIESPTGIITFHHDGLRRKKNPSSQTGLLNQGLVSSANNASMSQKGSAAISVSTRSPTVCTSSTMASPSHSPILKAQLSAPPRPLSSPPHVQRQLQPSFPSQPVSPSPPPSPLRPSPSSTPTHPPHSSSPGSSTLIKSLLASKVARNLQRQQLLQQQGVANVIVHSLPVLAEKIVNQNTATSTSSLVKNLNPKSVAQSPLPQSPRTPIQTHITVNKGKFLSSPLSVFPSRIKGSTTNLTPKAFKTAKCRAGTATTAARLNGVQREVQLEVCSQAEEARNLVETPTCQEAQIRRIQNHVPSEKHFVADSNDSVLTSDGESGVSFRESSFSSDSEQNSLSSLQCENSASSNSHKLHIDALQCSTGPLFSRSKLNSSVEKSRSGLEHSAVDGASFVNSHPMSPPLINQKPSSPKVPSPSNLLKSVLGEFETKGGDEPLRQHSIKGKVYKRSPLLNGLLDRGKLPLSKDKDFQSSNVIQNGNKKASATGTRELCVQDNKSSFSNTLSSCHSNSQNILRHSVTQPVRSGSSIQSSEQVITLKLDLDSPENSSTGSDLSSISDIARTLESASKTISRTNAECHSQVPFSEAKTVTTTLSGVTINTTSMSRTGQQIIVVTPAINPTQLHIQSPNIKVRLLHNVTKLDDPIELIGFPRVSLNQLNQLRQQPSEINLSAAAIKRPSSEHLIAPAVVDAKRPRQESKTPLLEATLRCPVTVPCSVNVVATSSCTGVEDTKSFQDARPQTLKSSGNEQTTHKLNSVKPCGLGQVLESHHCKEPEILSGVSPNIECSTKMLHGSVSPRHTSGSKLEYICEWKDCSRSFSTPLGVFVHASKVHAPPSTEDTVCLWENCDGMKRRRFSLLTHLQDWHCNERVLQIQALRRQQMAQQGKTSIAPPQPPPPHPGYAPDAALLAIRRHALQYLNPKEVTQEEKEGPLTRSVRLTSALVLRNLLTHSSLARSYIRRYEPELACLAMSPGESSRTIAQCLSELARPNE